MNHNLDIIDRLDAEEGYVKLVLASGRIEYGMPLAIIYNEDEDGWDTIKRILINPYFGIYSKDYGLDDIVSYEPVNLRKLSAVEKELARKLVKIWDDNDFVLGVICALKNDDERRFVLNHIETAPSDETAPEQLTILALCIKEAMSNQ